MFGAYALAALGMCAVETLLAALTAGDALCTARFQSNCRLQTRKLTRILQTSENGLHRRATAARAAQRWHASSCCLQLAAETAVERASLCGGAAPVKCDEQCSGNFDQDPVAIQQIS